mgnify:CR=1 FL=1|jgi:FOG: WD40 repeat
MTGGHPASGAVAWELAWTWGPAGRRPRPPSSRPGPFQPVPAWVTRLAGYPDDRSGRPRVLVTSYAGRRAVLDLRDGRVIGVPDERPHVGVCAAVRIDGEPVIVSAGAGHLQVSDLATGRPRWRCRCGEVRALATATLGGRPVAVLAGAAPRLQVWSLAGDTGQRLAVVRAGSGRVTALAATERDDDVLVALGGATGRISLWRLTGTGTAGAGVRIEPVGEHGFEIPELVSTLGFTRWRGRLVLLGAAGRLARAWEAAGAVPLGPSFAGHRGEVNSVAAGRLGTRPVVWSADDATVRAWLPETGRQLGEAFHYPYEAALTGTTVVDIDGRPTLVSGDAAGAVWVWDGEWPYPFRPVGTRSTSGKPDDPGAADPAPTDSRAADPARLVGSVRLAGVTLADDEPVVLAGFPDGTVRAVTGPAGDEVPLPVDGHRTAPLLVPGSHPTLARVTPDGIDLRDPVTGEHVGRVALAGAGLPASVGRRPGALASARVGDVWTLLLADGSTVYRADAVEGGSVVAWRDHSAPVHTVVTAELDGVPVALTASGDDTVRLWDLRSGRGLGVVLDGHGGAAYAVAAATVDGRALVFGAGRSGLVRAVDVTDLLRPDVPRDPAASGPAPGPAADPASGPADAGWAGAEPTPVLTAAGPVRSLAVAHSGSTGWLVVADGAALRWHPVTDDLEPGWTSGLTGPVTGLVAMPGLVVAATGDGLVAYRPTAATGAGRHAGAGRA